MGPPAHALPHPSRPNDSLLRVADSRASPSRRTPMHVHAYALDKALLKWMKCGAALLPTLGPLSPRLATSIPKNLTCCQHRHEAADGPAAATGPAERLRWGVVLRGLHLRRLWRRIDSARDEENWPTKRGLSICIHNQSCGMQQQYPSPNAASRSVRLTDSPIDGPGRSRVTGS